MKVLDLSTQDTRGGAARAAHRLHRGLMSIGVQSSMLVQSKASNSSSVFGPSGDAAKAWAKLRPRLDTLPLRLYPRRQRRPYSVQWVPGRTASKVSQHDPDAVNLHWICSGFLSVRSIATLERPLVWTLHDLWPFTGGCHYDDGCGRYTKTCGRCPLLRSTRETDLSRWTWWRKKCAWKDLDLTVVAPSRWLAECAQESSLFRDLRIETIPNGLDINRFKPVDKKVARAVLNLPLDKKLVLFGAMSATTDGRKGFDLLTDALRLMRGTAPPDQTTMAVLGADEPNPPVDLSFDAHYLGRLHDDISLNLVYAAADVFVAPSRQDNLPNTVLEALACGTPSVAFDIGGMPDMIDHERCGYLARPFDTEDLAHGIEWVLEDEARRQKLSRNAREKAVKEFNQKLQGRRYLELYEDILDRRGRALSDAD